MKIGLSLDPSYLAGKETPSATAWGPVLGEASRYLRQLREGGVTSIELGAQLTNPDQGPLLQTAAQQVWDVGLGITLHGKLPEIPEEIPGSDLGDIFPALLPILAGRPDRQQELIITLHCYEGNPARGSDFYAQQTREAVRGILGMIEEKQVPLRLALELSRKASPNVGPGFTYTDLTELVQRIDHPQAGLCWDLGHTYANLRNGVLPDQVPSDFASRVIHTHIHGLGPRGRTHFALTEESLPLASFIGPLVSAGYEGIYNLELRPQREDWEGLPVTAKFRESIEVLQECVLSFQRKSLWPPV